MTREELEDIITKHKRWLMDQSDGKRANLSGADLSGAVLSDANLRGADLSGAVLIDAILSDADLSDAVLSDAVLSGANLRGANLSDAVLSDANLSDADLSGADLSGAKHNHRTAFFHLACPEVGEFTAFKKLSDGRIAVLRIPETARRSSATTRKCRAEFAYVLDILGDDKSPHAQQAQGRRAPCTYEIGKTAVPDKWDDDRWNECSHGIHFFMTQAEAEAW